MKFTIFGPDARRSRLHQVASDGPLKTFLAHDLPSRNSVLRDVGLLAVDFETTGLNADTDEILSIGYVQINNLQIDLSTATHILIKTTRQLPAHTVVIHKITDDQVAQGAGLEDAIGELLVSLQGRVLVAHHAQIESRFLNQACRMLYGGKIIIPVIDTLKNEVRKHPNHNYGDNWLNLTMCSRRYNLPRYKLHDALSDALSCAELFLAQVASEQCPGKTRLGKYLQYLP